jgi:hypothetical protein
MRTFRRRSARAIPCVLAVGVLAAAGAPGAQAADIIEGGTLASAAGGDAIVLRIDPKAMRLRSAVLAVKARCANGRGYPLHIPVRTMPMSALKPGAMAPGDALLLQTLTRGTLRATLLRGEEVDGGRTAAISIELKGRLGRQRSSGTLKADVTVFAPGSEATETTCTTGTVRWSAVHAPGTVFAGATSQGEPIVLWTNARRTKLLRAVFGWHSNCTPEGGVDVPDELFNFAISRTGAFGDTFDWTPEDSKIRVDYSFSGKLSRTRASGKLDVVFRPDRDAGATTCPTGPLTWKADSR